MIVLYEFVAREVDELTVYPGIYCVWFKGECVYAVQGIEGEWVLVRNESGVK